LARIAGTYVKAGQQEKATAVFSHALQVATTLPNAAYKANALGAIAGQYAQARQYDHALQVATLIEEPYNQVAALAEIAASQDAQAGQQEKAMELLSQTLQVATTLPNAAYKANVLQKIAEVYARAGQYDHALQVATSIEEAHNKTAALGEIARAYGQAGRCDHALQVATTIEMTSTDTPSFQGSLLTTMAGHCAQAWPYTHALQVAKALESPFDKSLMLAAIARAKRGQTLDESARKILHEIISKTDF